MEIFVLQMCCFELKIAYYIHNIHIQHFVNRQNRADMARIERGGLSRAGNISLIFMRVKRKSMSEKMGI